MTRRCFIPGCRTGLLTQRRESRMENKKNPRLFRIPRNSYCFVPGCTTGTGTAKKRNRRNGIRNPSLFSVPEDWALLQIWQKVIPRADKKFSITDRICELHFTKDDINSHFESVLPDGEVFQMERVHATLKPNAIPTIFPNLPDYSRNIKNIVDEMKKNGTLNTQLETFKTGENLQVYSAKTSQSKKISTANPERTGDENIKEINSGADDANLAVNITDICDEDTNTSDGTVSIDTVNLSPTDKNAGEDLSEPEEITFNMLVRNLKAISKPSDLWSITEHGEFVMCAKWNENYIPEKRVVIDSNLNIKVFLKDKEIAAYNDMCLSEISDISTILHLIDK